MREFLIGFIRSASLEPTELLIGLVVLAIIAVSAILLHLLLHTIVLRSIKRYASSNQILAGLLEYNLFARLALVAQGGVVYAQAHIWLEEGFFRDSSVTMSLLWVALFALLSLYAVLDKLFDLLYRVTRSPVFAMKTIVQTLKLVVGIVVGIYTISILADKSPVAILSGLGAMSAVLMLIFKDTILGFSAGLQITTNKMVEIGDWIEMPKYGADGDVIDIGLNVVKVRNWDKTITTIPTYALVSDSFKNWRGMRESGGRRIKRAIPIDIKTISFLSEDDIKRLKKAHLLAPYLETKLSEIGSYNAKNDLDPSVAINSRRLTNIGTLRAYIMAYLKSNPNINQEMTIMVRQLSPSQFGLPLEIYCFTSTTNWVEYEDIQSDIFDHIYSVLDEFNLKSYQYS